MTVPEQYQEESRRLIAHSMLVRAYAMLLTATASVMGAATMFYIAVG